MKGVSEIGPAHPETDIGVALCPGAPIIRFLRTAGLGYTRPSVHRWPPAPGRREFLPCMLFMGKRIIEGCFINIYETSKNVN